MPQLVRPSEGIPDLRTPFSTLGYWALCKKSPAVLASPTASETKTSRRRICHGITVLMTIETSRTRKAGRELEADNSAYTTPIDIWRMARKQLIWIAEFGAIVFGIVPRILDVLVLAGLLIYKLKKKYYPSDKVEKLLQKCQILMPTRYSYPKIKIITRHFREKLGQGGFGAVFKGSLFDGRAVAVKLLGGGGEAKGGGQDFINEVATIGRIHHVNIIRLVGFCSEGSTGALLYEFMPNGSLDKYIFLVNNPTNHLLSWEMLYKIALGIARGIEYLHRGCDMCILHFDIKPHNVLLDEYFCPKISDFGLAKLSPTQNTMTLSGYRGTIGYIAPEQVSRNFGGVSYKSDVYSFGILLLQVVEQTRKPVVFAPAGSSQTYFPTWIYDRLSEGDNVGIGEATEIEEEIVNKLALVGLCCIQMMPANRPSMSQVIEMLEGSSDTLQLPPRPFLMLADEMPNKECSNKLSACQSDVEEGTFYSESNCSAGFSSGAI
ncbi:rust resistance kinase Lr10-like [Nymphaea colorata]|nr:rust resistance kinase Lr10-like [Nymphaea colorata]